MGLKLTLNQATVPMYKCTCCGREKPESEYGRQSYTGARTLQCKVCIDVKRAVKRHEERHYKFISKEKNREMTSRINYTVDDWRDAMIFFEGRCCYCGAKEGRAAASRHDREHLIPISMGGKTTRANVVPACRRCNRARGNKPLREWYSAQPWYTTERYRRILQWMNQSM